MAPDYESCEGSTWRMQLDIFNDSRDTMLRNDVVEALERRDAVRALAALRAFVDEFPQDEAIADAELLIMAIVPEGSTTFNDHDDARQARLALINEVEPAAVRVLGAQLASKWLSPLWTTMARRAAYLPFRADRPDEHAAPFLLTAHDWNAAVEAVGAVESWRRIPRTLAWMTQARCQVAGLAAVWDLIAELAWLSPACLAQVAAASGDLVLNRKLAKFGATFDGTDTAEDLEWFPAWVLTDEPGLAPFLAKAQRSRWTGAEQAMRTMVEILGFERQGRQRELLDRRRVLQALSPEVYRSYMATR